jgi:hypothetical protein
MQLCIYVIIDFSSLDTGCLMLNAGLVNRGIVFKLFHRIAESTLGTDRIECNAIPLRELKRRSIIES